MIALAAACVPWVPRLTQSDKWRIPAAAKGKRGTLRFTAAYDGVPVTQSYPVHVTK